MSFVSHLEGAIDGAVLPARALATTHADRPILVRYDLAAVGRAVDRDALRARPWTMWRYRELLPVEDAADVVTLVETATPLLDCPRLGAALGARRLRVKDESRLPTGSFKARGMAMAVAMAKRFGVRRVAVPTAGNAGGALAAYAARAGMACDVLMPADTPVVNRAEAGFHGAAVHLVEGLITDCGRIVRAGRDEVGWFDMSTLREPYRIEGKKTMGLELAEQCGWRLPGAILYPTGGGTGLIGMWKAFAELREIGWLAPGTRGGPDLPRMYACQSSGCAPIVSAFDRGERFATAPRDPHTVASGLRVPSALGDFLILDAVRESGGRAVAADEDRLVALARMASSLEGISFCPETGACLGVLERGIREGFIDPDEEVVVFNTAAAQKYVEVMETRLPGLDPAAPIDWATFRR
jgi:threonine synthase